MVTHHLDQSVPGQRVSTVFVRRNYNYCQTFWGVLTLVHINRSEELWIPLLLVCGTWVLSVFRHPQPVSNICPISEATTNLELGRSQSLLLQGLPRLAVAGWCGWWGATTGHSSLCHSKSGNRWEEILSSWAVLVSQINVFCVHRGNKDSISQAMSYRQGISGIMCDTGHASPCNSRCFKHQWFLSFEQLIYAHASIKSKPLTNREEKETSTMSTLLCTMWFLVPSSVLTALVFKCKHDPGLNESLV